MFQNTEVTKNDESKIYASTGKDTIRYVYGVPPDTLKTEDRNLNAEIDELIDIAKEAGMKPSDKTIGKLKSIAKYQYCDTYDSNTLKGNERPLKELLDAIDPLVTEYRVAIDVGYDTHNHKRIIIYHDDVTYLAYLDDDIIEATVYLEYAIGFRRLYPVRIILRNIILALSEASREKRDTTRGLKAIARFVASLAKDCESNDDIACPQAAHVKNTKDVTA